MIRIVIPFDPNTCSQNRRLHWRERAARNARAKEAAAIGYRLAGEPVAAGPVRVSMLVRRGRVLDEDNARTGMKPVWDFLFNRRITPDDSRRWVRHGEVDFETGAQWRDRPEVVVTVVEVEPLLAAPTARTAPRGEERGEGPATRKRAE